MSTLDKVGVAAGVAAASAAVNTLLAVRAESRNPPVGRFITVDGVKLHYVERGSDAAGGRPIILIHGNGSLAQEMLLSGLVERLQGRHRVIIIDRPGYGYSERPSDRDWSVEQQGALFARAAAMLGAANPIVVGHSLGTLPAVSWALDRPGEVSGLVLISGYYFPTLRPDITLQRAADTPLVSSLLSRTWVPLQARLTGPLGNRQIFAPRKPTRRYLDRMPFELILRPGQLKATIADGGQLRAAAARLQHRYAGLTLPMLVVWGEGDKLVGQKGHSARLAAELPHARRLSLRGVGHMAHHSEPHAVANAIEALAVAA